MSFANTARAVVEADEAARIRGEILPLSAREELFVRGLRAEGYGAGLAWLAEKADHTRTCKALHSTPLLPGTPLARDLLKLVSYGYVKGLMQRHFKLSLGYPELGVVAYAGAGTLIHVPVYKGDVGVLLATNPLAQTHLLAMAEQAVAQGGTVIHAVAPSTEAARQLLNVLAGESSRAAVRGWLEARLGSGLDLDWYGCCAPAIAPKGKLSLTLDEQLKYQTMPEVMC